VFLTFLRGVLLSSRFFFYFLKRPLPCSIDLVSLGFLCLPHFFSPLSFFAGPPVSTFLLRLAARPPPYSLESFSWRFGAPRSDAVFLVLLSCIWLSGTHILLFFGRISFLPYLRSQCPVPEGHALVIIFFFEEIFLLLFFTLSSLGDD